MTNRDTGYVGLDSTSHVECAAIRDILPHPDRVAIVGRRRSAAGGINNLTGRGLQPSQMGEPMAPQGRGY